MRGGGVTQYQSRAFYESLLVIVANQGCPLPIQKTNFCPLVKVLPLQFNIGVLGGGIKWVNCDISYGANTWSSGTILQVLPGEWMIFAIWNGCLMSSFSSHNYLVLFLYFFFSSLCSDIVKWDRLSCGKRSLYPLPVSLIQPKKEARPVT